VKTYIKQIGRIPGIAAGADWRKPSNSRGRHNTTDKMNTTTTTTTTTTTITTAIYIIYNKNTNVYVYNYNTWNSSTSRLASRVKVEVGILTMNAN